MIKPKDCICNGLCIWKLQLHDSVDFNLAACIALFYTYSCKFLVEKKQQKTSACKHPREDLADGNPQHQHKQAQYCFCLVWLCEYSQYNNIENWFQLLITNNKEYLWAIEDNVAL